jgi:hypothetical protein
MRDPDDLDNHHPTCPSGCGELADECMCTWPPFAVHRSQEYDGRDPGTIEHLCIDLTIKDGPVSECCESEWRAEGAEP